MMAIKISPESLALLSEMCIWWPSQILFNGILRSKIDNIKWMPTVLNSLSQLLVIVVVFDVQLRLPAVCLEEKQDGPRVLAINQTPILSLTIFLICYFVTISC